jgi:hypothetical protein
MFKSLNTNPRIPTPNPYRFPIHVYLFTWFHSFWFEQSYDHMTLYLSQPLPFLLILFFSQVAFLLFFLPYFFKLWIVLFYFIGYFIYLHFKCYLPSQLNPLSSFQSSLLLWGLFPTHPLPITSLAFHYAGSSSLHRTKGLFSHWCLTRQSSATYGPTMCILQLVV